jgi:hypothetical protein
VLSAVLASRLTLVRESHWNAYYATATTGDLFVHTSSMITPTSPRHVPAVRIVSVRPPPPSIVRPSAATAARHSHALSIPPSALTPDGFECVLSFFHLSKNKNIRWFTMC